MKNMERFKDKTLQNAAGAYLETKGILTLHAWNCKDWVDFAYWLFKDEIWKYRLDYTVPGNNYDQTFWTNATDDKQAVKALLKEVPNAVIQCVLPIDIK